MIAYFFSLAKRYNSTYRPTLENNTHTDTEVVLKEATSVLYPVISVAQNLSQCNYVHIPALGNRYYFIREWSYADGLWWASCEVDVLASYRAAVYGTQLYCLRSARSADWNKSIVDELSVRTNDIRYSYTSITSPWMANLNAGVYVIGVINNDSASYGACSYYVLTAPQFGALKSYLMSQPSYITADFSTFDISEDLLKALFNPYQYIASAMFFPVAGLGGTDADDVDSIPVGWWATGTPGRRILPTPYYNDITITKPRHPQSGEYYTYLDGPDYTRYILHFPPFQDMVLDSAQVQKVATFKIRLLIDPGTGKGSLKITDGSGSIVLGYTESQIGVPIQIAQMSADYTSVETAAASALAGLANAATSSSILSLLKGAAGVGTEIMTGIGQVSTAFTGKMLSSGSNGSLAAFFNCTPQLQSTFVIVTEPNYTEVGYPACYTTAPSEITGYALFLQPHVPIPAPGTVEEQEKLNNLLASGIFCEW